MQGVSTAHPTICESSPATATLLWHSQLCVQVCVCVWLHNRIQRDNNSTVWARGPARLLRRWPQSGIAKW